MATESGKNGKVLIGATSIANITMWTLEKSVFTTRFASSSTNGKKATVAGVGEASGTIEFKNDPTVASPITEGASVTLKLYRNTTQFYSMPCVIKTFRESCNIDTGEVIGGTATFESNGDWIEPVV